MTDNARNFQPIRHRRRLRRYFMGTAVVMCAVWVIFVFFGQGALLTAAQRYLRQAVGLPVVIESAGISLTGSVHLSNVSIMPDKSAARQRPILTAGLVHCRFGLLSLLWLHPRVSSLSIRNFTLYVEYDDRSRRWNMADIGFGSKELSGRAVPKLTARDGRLCFCHFSGPDLMSSADIAAGAAITSGRFGQECRFILELHGQAGNAARSSRIQGRWQRKGGKGSVELAGRLMPADTSLLGNAWNLEKVSLACEYDRSKISLSNLEWKMGDGSGRLCGLVRKDVCPAEYDLEVSMENHHFGPLLATDTIVYSPQLMGFFDPKPRELLDRYQPSGSGDVHLRIQGRIDDLAASRINGTVLCRDVRLTDRQFPYTMENLQGAIKFNGQSLCFESLRAGHGGNRFKISGSVTDFGPQKRLQLRMYCPRMAFDEDLYRALRDEHKKLWFAFAPSGSGSIDYRYQKLADHKPQVHLEVDLIDAKAAYEHFAYPLANLKGRLVIEPNQVILERVAGSLSNGGTVEINGKAVRTSSGLPDLAVNVRAVNIPFDSSLRAALSGPGRRLFDDFEIDGRADMQAGIFSDPQAGQSPSFVADVQAKGASIIYKRLPSPLRKFQMEAQIRPETAVVKRFTAEMAGGSVAVSGGFLAMGQNRQQMGRCVSVRADGIRPDPNFTEAIKALAPQILPRLRIEGQVDVGANWSENMPVGSCPGNRIEITCRDNNVRFVSARPVTVRSGLVVVDDKQLVMKDFIVDGISPDEKFGSILPGPLRQFYTSIAPDGRFGVNLRNFVLTVAGIVFDGSVSIDNGRFGSAGAAGNVRATVDLCGDYSTKNGLGHLSGDVRAESLDVMGRRFQNIGFPFVFEPDGRQIVCRDITADCGSGNITGRMVLQCPQAGQIGYQLELVFENVLTECLLAPSLTAEQKISGQLQGSLDIAGVLGSGMEGHIGIYGQQMRLGAESLLGKALTAMKLQEPVDYVFSDIDAEAYIDNGNIICDSVRISGRQAVFTGSGTLKNNRLNILLTAFDRPDRADSRTTGGIFESLGSAIATVEITGDIDNPHIRQTTLPVIGRPLEMLGPRR